MGDFLSGCCCDASVWFDLARWHFADTTPGTSAFYYGPDVTFNSDPNDYYLVSPTASGANATGQNTNSLTEGLWDLDLSPFVGTTTNTNYYAVTGEGYVAGFSVNGVSHSAGAWSCDADGTNLQHGTANPSSDFQWLDEFLLVASQNINYFYYFGLLPATFSGIARYNWEFRGTTTNERGLYVPPELESHTKGGGSPKLSFGDGECFLFYPTSSTTPVESINGYTCYDILASTNNSAYDLLVHSTVDVQPLFGSVSTRKVSDIVYRGFYGPEEGEEPLSVVFLRNRLNKTCVSIESVYGGTITTTEVDGITYYDVVDRTHTKKVKVGIQTLGELTSESNIEIYEVDQEDPTGTITFIPPVNEADREKWTVHNAFKDHQLLDDLYDVDTRLFDGSESADGTTVNAFALLTDQGVYYGGESFTPALIYTPEECFKGYKETSSGSDLKKVHSLSWFDTYDDIRQWCFDNGHSVTGWDSNPPPLSAWSAIGAETITSLNDDGLEGVPWLEGPIIGLACPPKDTSDPNGADAIFMFSELQIRNASTSGLSFSGTRTYTRLRLEFWRQGTKFAVVYSDLGISDPNPCTINDVLEETLPRFLAKTKRFTYVKMSLPGATSQRVAVRNDASGFFDCTAKQYPDPTGEVGDLLDIAFSNYDEAPPTGAANKTLVNAMAS